MWVFGYGSLMWDDWEQPFGGMRVDRAVLMGHRRSFNKKSVVNWGTSAALGPTLGLEPAQNAVCAATAFEFPEEQRAAVQNLLRRREGESFSLDDPPLVRLSFYLQHFIKPYKSRKYDFECSASAIPPSGQRQTQKAWLDPALNA
jgi:cation transport regulator ChaC